VGLLFYVDCPAIFNTLVELLIGDAGIFEIVSLRLIARRSKTVDLINCFIPSYINFP